LGGPLQEKEYKITKIQLGTKVNSHLEWETAKITYLKKLKIPQTSHNTEK
jgi:hypothetical protein